MGNRIIPYRDDLKIRAQQLRNNQTPAEKMVWGKIRKRSLGVEFHRQVQILDYIVDFYCHEIGLVIEIDGTVHTHNFMEDAKRQGRIEKYGTHFLRFTNIEVLQNIESVIKTIQDYITKNR